MIDYNWNLQPDYNPEANKIFAKLYPNAKLGDQDWLDFRAQGLTDLIGIKNSGAAAHKKASYLVQTWPAKSDGTLFSSQFIKDKTGLDLDTILNFKGPKKLTYLVTELIWQQWAAEYGTEYFSPKWAGSAGNSFIKFVSRRTLPVVHVELSRFKGRYIRL
ncbi:MAG: hypothetical protein ABL930_00540 [Pseudobdellovibrio sp.]